MATFSVTFTVWFDRPAGAPNPGLQVVGEHYATLEFECACAGIDGKPVPDVDPARDGAAIRLVGDPVADEPWIAVGPPLDDAWMLRPRLYVRRANCTEGPGILFFAVAAGGYDPRVPNQPFTFLEYEVAASWRVCCCCDPDSGKASHSIALHRGPKVSVADHAKGFVFEVVYDDRKSCDAAATRETRRIDTRD
jgi:hypothetical protein